MESPIGQTISCSSVTERNNAVISHACLQSQNASGTLKRKNPNPKSQNPNRATHCREVIDNYGSAVFKLMTRLLELISKGLGVEPDAIAKQAEIHDPGAAIRTDFNCYPPCPQPKLVLGSAPHCDRGVLTVLQQDQVSGLQVAKEGTWFPVPPMMNAFVINLGDQMQVLLEPYWHFLYEDHL